jgi:hypothetical protein
MRSQQGQREQKFRDVIAIRYGVKAVEAGAAESQTLG